MLVELSVMEQRYQAVLAVVQDGWHVSCFGGCGTDGTDQKLAQGVRIRLVT